MSFLGLATLNKTATAVFERVVELAKANPDEDGYLHFKLNNSPAFMELCAENIYSCECFGETWECWSFAHYYEQYGDLMRDPEMCFMYSEKHHTVIPYMYCMDAFGTYQESVNISENTYKPRMQREHTSFANRWMGNIKQQQKLKIPRVKTQGKQ